MALTASSKRIIATTLITIGLVVVLLGALGVRLFHTLTAPPKANVAEQDMSRITTSLQKLGVKAVCGEGDNGYGFDNRQPWYVEYYIFEGSTDTALEKVKSAVGESGYQLTPDTNSDGTPIPFSYINELTLSKKHPELERVPINLHVHFFSADEPRRSEIRCSDGSAPFTSYDPTSTAQFEMSLQLPSTK